MLNGSPTRVLTKDQAKAARRARAAAEREAARKAERRRTILVRSALAAIVLAIAGGVTFVLVTAPGAKPTALPTPPVATGTAPPPWPAPADPAASIARAGLKVPKNEAGAHFHSHVDIRVDGKAVPVAANLGVGPGTMSELHTHDTAGLIHIESDAKSDRYVLGQVFAEWGVRLDASRLGSFTNGGGRTLAAYVDGKRFRGNPAQIELLPRRQIALVFGTAAQQKNPPAKYDFQPGD